MEAAQARLNLHLLKCHIVGNHMSRLNYNLMLSANKSGSDASMYIYENTIKFKGVSVLIRHQFLCNTALTHKLNPPEKILQCLLLCIVHYF